MATLDPMNSRRVAGRVPVEIVDRLDRLATADRRSRSEVVRFALEEYVQRHAPKEKTP